MSEQIYRNLDALIPVQKLLAEASEATDQTERTCDGSELHEVLAATAGLGVGAGAGAAIVAAGATESTAGAAFLTSGLAWAGGFVGGGMAAGIAVVAAPAVILSLAGYGIVSHVNKRKLTERKDLLYHQALRKHDALIRKLAADNKFNDDRVQYLSGLVSQLKAAIVNLQADLAGI
jgi:hypothetical protein